MLQFINSELPIDKIKQQLSRMIVPHDAEGVRVPVLEGAIVIDDFLTPEARQQLEGHVYSSGFDLNAVYKTSRTGFGDNELNITEADRQIPLFANLRVELDAFLSKLFDGEITTHTMQLRELTPKSSGHSRHVDYERAFDVVERSSEKYAITSVSLSLPISWNDGRAPVFIMETSAGNVDQAKPGSLAIFGPTIFHAHPPTTDFVKPYLWLVTQAFFKLPIASGAKSDQQKEKPPVTVSPAAESCSVAQWARNIVTNAHALELLQNSETRIRRAYKELLSGYEIDPATILNEVEHVTDYKGIVVEEEIHFTSLCGHHFLPFHGTVDVCYEPNEIITGIGKLPRLVQAFSRRLQLQEDLVRDIAQEISTRLNAKGVLVTARAVHLCIHGRGPLAPGSRTVCTYAMGTLERHYDSSIPRR
jgi:GTP cyclohydrolase I